MKRTNKETESKVIDFYSLGNSMQLTALEFGISATTVLRILQRNKISIRTNGGIYKLPEQEIVNKYKSGNSCTQIAKEYNVTFHTISNILEKHNIDRNNIYHNLNLLEDYWETINSYDKAYFLGLLLADGNVYGNQVKIELSSKDKHILEIFSIYTKNTNKLIKIDRQNKGKFVAFSVKREKWVNDLNKFGVIPNKTFNLTLPILSEEMMSHLIRGLIDGDGWISEKGKQVGFCGTEKCVTQLRDYLCSKLNISTPKVVHPDTNLWQITWHKKKDIKTICEFIYKDKNDCFLKRKYDNYLKLIHGNTEITEETNKSSAL